MANNILAAAEAHVTAFIEANVKPEYFFHDLQHTRYTFEAVGRLAEDSQLDAESLEIVQLAAWFHDTGYNEGPAGHELRSCEHARRFFAQNPYPEEKINRIIGCIMATKLPQQPRNLTEEILCDADLSHLGNEYYWERCGKLRQELLVTQNIVMSDQEWLDFELDFMTNHQYHTDAALELYSEQKQKHVRQLRKQKLRVNPKLAELIDDAIFGGDKKKKKQKLKSKDYDLKEINLGRGVETMYRTTYRTHINLSSIADSKANIMLSINAIIISIVVSNLVPKFGEIPRLVPPTIVLLCVCLVALVFAILSTRPKVTEGNVTREDIEQKRANLLFFGNFFNMRFDDFHWGIMEMIKDRDFLYSSMTKDLFYLGIVLAKKYRYLSICYGIFMYGIIISVALFALAFLV
mgnify:CR=1 FL=1